MTKSLGRNRPLILFPHRHVVPQAPRDSELNRESLPAAVPADRKLTSEKTA